MAKFKEKLGEIKAFIFDVDGVLASSKVTINKTGDLTRQMNTKDGYALQYAIKKGYPVCIITGGREESIKVRFNKLGVDDVYLESINKIVDFKDFLYKYDFKGSDIAYMGDDIPDIEVMKEVGVPACPSNASPEVKEQSDYISPYKGGDGCVRDIIEQVLKVQKQWMVEPQINN